MMTHVEHVAQCLACREHPCVLAVVFIIAGIIPFTAITPAWLTLLPANNAMVNPGEEPPEPPTFFQ